MPELSPKQSESQAEPNLVPDGKHLFFDPRNPIMPEQVLGTDTAALLQLGRAATSLGVLPPTANLTLYKLPHVLRIMPLIEELSSRTSANAEVIRPYRKPIKRLSPSLTFVDRLAATTGALAVGVPLRRRLNRRIESEFPAHLDKVMDQARDAVNEAAVDVAFIANFKNPRDQFVTELNDVAQAVGKAIANERHLRIQRGSPLPEPEVPKGLLGYVTKVVRKIRGFFGLVQRRPVVNKETTAYDAGVGIEKVFKKLMDDPEDTSRRMPLLSKLVLSKLPGTAHFKSDQIAFLAPELLDFLFSTSQPDHDVNSMIADIRRNPHELRFITRFKKRHGRYSLEGIQQASRTLMPAIRDVLPTEGDAIRRTYAHIQGLLQPRVDGKHTELDTTEDEPKNQKLKFRKRISALFRKKRSPSTVS